MCIIIKSKMLQSSNVRRLNYHENYHKNVYIVVIARDMSHYKVELNFLLLIIAFFINATKQYQDNMIILCIADKLTFIFMR